MALEETIVAVATPPGYGGVGIVRLSGPLSHTIAKTITAHSFKPHAFKVCQFMSHDHVIIDQGIVLYFKAPRSFTGEEVIEFHGHGSPVVLDQLLKRCVELGARMATPGEFSLRAFLNGKIDLLQAEAIADLIHANSETAAKMAMQSLQGVFSTHLHVLNQALVNMRVSIEAMIDFPDEEVEWVASMHIKARLEELLQQMEQLQHSARQGAMVREGVVVVIAGPPNAGKSTLMNALSGKDIAIVTDLPGTTRDVIQEGILIEGIPLTVVDTAGLRQTDCMIEKEGIKRAHAMLRQAQLVLFVQDSAQHNLSEQEEKQLLNDLTPLPKIINLYNKIDQSKHPAGLDDQGIYISAKTGAGLDTLKQAILQAVGYSPQEGGFIARRRHLDALSRSKKALGFAIHQLESSAAIELVAEELRLSHQALSEITGAFTSDDLLGEIFSTFCIGK